MTGIFVEYPTLFCGGCKHSALMETTNARDAVVWCANQRCPYYNKRFAFKLPVHELEIAK